MLREADTARRALTGTTPVVVVVAALHLAFVVARLATFGWDPSAFVVAGEGVTDVAEAPDSIGVHRGVDGYDGQAYYRLARDPLTDDVEAHGIGFTRPAYWQTRIGYPAAAWALSLGGQERLVPAALLAVNLLAVAALAAVAAALARRCGRTPWLALVPGLWAGYLVGVGQNLTEPLAGVLLLAAVLALRRERWAWAAALLTGAALIRETTLVLAAAVVAVALVAPLHRVAGSAESGRVPPWWIGAVPVALYVAWRAWVRQRWEGAVPDAPGDNVLTAPLLGLGRHLATAAADPAAHLGNLILLALTAAALAIVASGLLARDGGLPHERLALAAYLLLLACLPVWDREQAYLRWCCEPVLLGWVVLVGARERRRTAGRLRALGTVTAALWLATALATYDYPGPEGWTPAAASAPAPGVAR